MKRKIFIISGLFLIFTSLLWHTSLSSRWTERIPRGWKWEASFIGTQLFPDANGVMQGKGIPSIYLRRITVVDESKRPDVVVLKDQYVMKDPMTNKTLWEYTTEGPVDPRTGEHLGPDHRRNYNLLPRNIEKKTYRFRANYIEGIPLAFQGEEEMEGLVTYIFAYKGRGEYTKSYKGSAEYPGIEVSAGQEIKCADDQFVFKVWVEPVTGEIIKLEESCYSGDYIYEISSGRRLSAILVWGGATLGDDNLRRIEQVKYERQKLLLISRYLPLTGLLAGIILIGVAILKRDETR